MAEVLMCGHVELATAVERVCCFGLGGIGGEFFAVADRCDARAVYAEVHEVVAYREGALLAEGEVVFLGAAFVAVAFHLDQCAGSFVCEDFGVGF